MKKLTINNLPFDLEKTINLVQKEFSDLKIDRANLIDALTYLTEKENCRKCKSLAGCLNHQTGYLFNYANASFSFKPCRYLKQHNNNVLRDDLFRVFYYPKSIKTARISDFYNNSEIRKRLITFHQKTLSDFKIDRTLCKNIFLAGANNVGKTYFLACLCNAFVDVGFSAALVYVPDLASNLKNSFNNPEKLEAILNHLRDVDLLCLDDIGAEVKSDWFRDEILGSLINLRVKDHRLTCYSSNLDKEQLKEFYSSFPNDPAALRIYNRIITNTILINLT